MSATIGGMGAGDLRWPTLRRARPRRDAADLLQRGVGLGLILLLALAPLPLGSNRPIPWTILALATGLLLLAWSVAATLRPAASAPPLEPFWPSILGVGLVVLLTLLQMAPLTPRSWHHPLWLEAAAVLGPEASGRISVNPYGTATALMRLLTNAGVFWLALQLARRPGQARRIIVALVVIGLGYAVYGLLTYVWSPDTILWWRKWYFMPGLTSTFVCRGCYAAYAGLGLLCACGLLITTIYRDPAAAEPGEAPGVRWRAAPWRASALLAAATCLAVALLLTASRTGVTASVLALGVLLACFGLSRLMAPRHLQVSILVTVALGVAVFALAGDEVTGRIANTQIERETRFEAFGRIARAIADAPWLGSGYGTFGEAFRSYQGPMSGYWSFAHNTYLELAFELGVAATLILLAAIGALAGRCALQLRQRRRTALYPALGVAATALIGLDALLDFPPQIPAVAVTYAAILGVACAHLDRGRRAARRRPRPSAAALGATPQERARRLGIGLGAVLASGLLVLGVPRLGAQLTALPLGLVIADLQAGQTPSPPALDRAIVAGEAATAWAESPEIWGRLGMAELVRSLPPEAPAGAEDAKLARAEQALRRSLALAPANPLSWAHLANVTLRRGGDPATISGALAASVLSAPNPGNLMIFRSSVAISAWGHLDARTRSLFPDQVMRAMRHWPQSFVEAVRGGGRIDVVRRILEQDPELRQRFDRILGILGEA